MCLITMISNRREIYDRESLVKVFNKTNIIGTTFMEFGEYEFQVTEVDPEDYITFMRIKNEKRELDKESPYNLYTIEDFNEKIKLKEWVLPNNFTSINEYNI